MQPPAHAAVAVISDMSGLEYEEVYEMLAGSESTDLHPDEIPLLANADGEFWTVTAPSSSGVLWKSIEDILSEQSNS